MTWASFCWTFQAVVWVTPEAAGKLKAGDTLLGLGDQVDGLEPDDQFQLGGMEDGAGGQGNLMAAGAALVELALLDLAASPAAAARADETLRPTPGSQRRPALFLGSVECAKLPLTEAFLELDLVACHGELHGKAEYVHYLYHTKQAEDSA